MTTVILTVTPDKFDLFRKVGALRSFDSAQDDILGESLTPLRMTEGEVSPEKDKKTAAFRSLFYVGI